MISTQALIEAALARGLRDLSTRKKLLVDRFFEKAVIPENPDECWDWTGSKDYLGYGRIYAYGALQKSSRVSYWIYHGTPIPPWLVCCHSCDNPRCNNPRHLWAGTIQENTLDGFRKGRIVRKGVKHKKVKSPCIRGHERTEKGKCKICLRQYHRDWRAKKAAIRASQKDTTAVLAACAKALGLEGGSNA